MAAAVGALLIAPSAYAGKSVYLVDPLLDGAVIGVTALGTIWANSNAENLIRFRCPCDPSEVNGLDRPVIGNSSQSAAGASDVTAALAVAVPVVADWIDLGTTPELAEDFVVFAEVMSLNAALANLLKYTTQRPLPRTYAGDPELLVAPEGYRSFYSGHVSTTFSALSAASFTLGLRHGGRAWPWIVTAATGFTVAAERVAAGRHFYTDVAVGALAGAAVGIFVPWLHEREGLGSGSVSAVPVSGGAMLAWRRSF